MTVGGPWVAVEDLQGLPPIWGNLHATLPDWQHTREAVGGPRGPQGVEGGRPRTLVGVGGSPGPREAGGDLPIGGMARGLASIRGVMMTGNTDTEDVKTFLVKP